jgi:putative peptidoglycan lipid II flippase
MANQTVSYTKTSQTRNSLTKTFSLVAIVGLASKFIGLVRDLVVLTTFGPTQGPIADAYNFALLLTGNILVLFGGLGGPFHSCCVTVLTSRKNSPEVAKLITQLLVWIAMLMGALAALIYLFADPIVAILVPAQALSESQRLALRHETIEQMRIMTPMIMIAGLVGTGCGISNVYNEFFWPSFAPAIASLGIITAVLFFPQYGGTALAVGTLIGAVGQFLVQLPGMLKANSLSFKSDIFTRLQPGMREYLSMLWPAFFGTAIGQLTIYVDSNFASNLSQGSWTAINNANRLIQLPLGVLLTAMLVPILPRFTEQVLDNKIDDLKAELRKALRILWFLCLPMAALFFTLGKPIIELLFEHKNFNAQDTTMFTLVLDYFIPYMFFYVARDLLVRVFYAHKDFQTPYKIALMAIFTKFALNWLLVVQFKLEVAGVALATTIMTVINMSWLIFLLARKIGNLGITKLFRPLAIMGAATAACSLASYYPAISAPKFLAPYLTSMPLISKLLLPGSSILAGGICGTLAYLLVCHTLKLEELQTITTKVVSRLKAK